MAHQYFCADKSFPRYATRYVFVALITCAQNKDGLVKAPGQATSRTVLNVFGDMKASRHMLDSLRTGSINDDFYTEGDLLIGNTIEVYGRPMLICDCDESTKQFISTNFGIEDNTPLPMEQVSSTSTDYCLTVAPSQSFVQAVEAELPPPTGFGTDEDSLASCRQLIPKVPKKKPGKFLPVWHVDQNDSLTSVTSLVLPLTR